MGGTLFFPRGVNLGGDQEAIKIWVYVGAPPWGGHIIKAPLKKKGPLKDTPGV